MQGAAVEALKAGFHEAEAATNGIIDQFIDRILVKVER